MNFCARVFGETATLLLTPIWFGAFIVMERMSNGSKVTLAAFGSACHPYRDTG